MSRAFMSPPWTPACSAEGHGQPHRKELILRKALEVTRTHYDVIVIDCPPHIGGLTVNASLTADCVLVPTSLAALSVSGVSGLLEAADEVQSTLNPQLDIAGCCSPASTDARLA